MERLPTSTSLALASFQEAYEVFMSILNTRNIATLSKVGAGILVLVFACFMTLTAQEAKGTRKKKGEPPHKASQQQAKPARPTPAGKPKQAGGRSQPQVVRYASGQPHTIRMANGGMVRKNESGHVVEVRTPGGAVIHHSPTGVRRVEVVHPGNRVVVVTGHGHGYVQRPVVFANHTFVQRTYVVRGVTYARVYRPVTFHGLVLHVYTPMRYYRPSFYVWAFNPWPRPIVYSWGWMRDPWYRFYGGYFAPYPSYVSPTLWLTDFLIASSLQAAYEERIAAAAAPPPPAYPPVTQPVLTPEVKQLIADEVRRQIDQEKAESQNVNAAAYGSSDIPPMFADNSRHVFVVSSALTVSSGAQVCTLGEGAVIQTLGVPPMNSPTADAIVLASKPQECSKGAVVSVQISDLQEMHNHMRETIDRGLGDLQSRGGQAGLPAPPPDSTGTTDAPFAKQVQPDTNVSNELTQAAQEADRAEQTVIDQSTAVAAGTGAAPITISLGQTIDQVVAIQGQPQKIVDLGNKKIYVYADIKITFIDGRVADVQ